MQIDGMKRLLMLHLCLILLHETLSYDPSSPSRAKKYKEFVRQLSKNQECDIKCVDELARDARTEDHNPSFEFQDTAHISKDLRQQPVASIMECINVRESLRFDCFPEGGADQSSCESRGCCWNATISRLPGEEVPLCFYPPSYTGYEFQDLTNATMGPSVTLARATTSGYPNDIAVIKVDFIFETDTRIRVRIYDQSSARWEAPLPAVPEVTSPASNPQYQVEVDEISGQFAIMRPSGQFVFDTRGAAPLTFADQFLQLSTHLPSVYIYGLGQHLEGLALSTNWHRRVLWNYDQGIKPDTNLYGSHPFYISMEADNKAHGLFLLTSNTVDIMIQPSPAITFRALGGILDFYLFLGPTPSEVVQQYTDVIGKPFLPPYWSLGYHQCRYNYFSLNRTSEVLEQTRDAGIPFDVQWNDIDSLELFRIFTYNLTFYDGLPEFVDYLHSIEMKYIPIVDPGLPYDVTPGEYPPSDEALQGGVIVMDDYGDLPYVGTAWPGEVMWPDFTDPAASSYWTRQFQIYQDLLAYDGAWLDMNEPADFHMTTDMCNSSSSLNQPPFLPPVEGGFISYRTICMSSKQFIGEHYYAHNLYSITNSIATNTALRSVRGRRPFIISRSSYPGLGHYAGHWTGDSESTFIQLYYSISDILNFGLFGVPMVGADICGFNLNTTVPLCKMWYLVGALYPFARNHNNEFCIPQDPVSLGPEVTEVARNSLTVRYRLLPYLYTLFFHAHLTGEPVARPLFYEYPDDVNTYLVDNEFTWGKSLLIAPALFNESYTISAYVPSGLWYDWYDGSLRYDNLQGEYIDMDAPELWPNLLFKGGYVIPIQAPDVTTAASRRNNFGLEVALDRDSEARGELYWDDGDSLNTISFSEYNHLVFTASYDGLDVTTTIGYNEPMTLDYVRVAGLNKEVTSVTVNGELVPFSYSNQVLEISQFTQSLLEDFSILW